MTVNSEEEMLRHAVATAPLDEACLYIIQELRNDIVTAQKAVQLLQDAAYDANKEELLAIAGHLLGKTVMTINTVVIDIFSQRLQKNVQKNR